LRYLVSNFSSMKNLRRCWGSFHPLYSGTWFPTPGGVASLNPAYQVSIRYIAVLGFQQRVYLRLAAPGSVCFHPLYRGTWFPTACSETQAYEALDRFPSAISRYLVSNYLSGTHLMFRPRRFHPLYRGTWFPTALPPAPKTTPSTVSIRYIAVLGI